ncbi:MAG: UTRA domain-containing protein [Micromonosporaceae bacterium]
MASQRQQVLRNPERYQWEKDRVRLSAAARRSTGAAERDTGLSRSELRFAAEYRTIPATPELAKQFGVVTGEMLLQRIYRTFCREEDAPLGLVYSYLCHDLAAQNPALLDSRNEPWPGGTQHQLFTLGIELDRIVDHLRARPPTRYESAALCVPAGNAVLTLHAVSIATSGRVVEVSEVVAPGDRTEFVYTTALARWT